MTQRPTYVCFAKYYSLYPRPVHFALYISSTNWVPTDSKSISSYEPQGGEYSRTGGDSPSPIDKLRDHAASGTSVHYFVSTLYICSAKYRWPTHDTISFSTPIKQPRENITNAGLALFRLKEQFRGLVCLILIFSAFGGKVWRVKIDD